MSLQKMSRVFYLYIIVQFSALSVFAQKYTLSGFVNDYETGEAIAGAYVRAGQTKTAITNSYGFFSIQLNKNDSCKIISGYVGYFSFKKTISTSIDTMIHIKLRPSNVLEEVTVYGKKRTTMQAGNNKLSIAIQDILLMPQTGGESDVIKAWQTLPTVGFGDEAKSNLLVRGGSSDQNLILLDDVPLFYINHLGGFFSIFNTDALSSADLYAGAFPSKYSGRLSSIADIRMREGNNKSFAGTASVGLLSSRFALEGPIIKNKCSFLLSARTSYLPLFTKIFDLGLHYNFYDLNFKANYKLSQRDKLYLSYYKGNDKLKTLMGGSLEANEISNELRWGNEMYALRWNHVFSNRLFANTVIYYSRYNYLSEFVKVQKNNSMYESVNAMRKSAISDLGLKYDNEFYISEKSGMTFGLHLTNHFFAPMHYNYEMQSSETQNFSYSSNSDKIISHKVNFYTSHRVQIVKHLSVDYGLNLVAYYYDALADFFPEARINFKLPFNVISFDAAYARMSQDIHSIRNSSEAVQSDYFIPASKQYPFQYSDIFSIGVKSNITGKISMSVSAYHKKFHNLISPTTGIDFFKNNTDTISSIESGGKGTAYGIESLSSFRSKKTSLNISVSFNKSVRKFESFNKGKIYPYDYNRTFKFNLSGTYRLTKTLKVSVNWIFAGGRPMTLPVGKIMSDEGDYILLYENINNALMESYHRLDLAFVFEKKIKLGKSILNISLFNLYNRKNPYYYFIDYGSDETGLSLYKQSLFPIMPSISYSLEF
jgi:hypothetical protein